MDQVTRSPKRRLALALALLVLSLAVAALGIWRLTPGRPPPPNIILIVVDTLRQDHLGCYGFQGDISPAIDRFASVSIVFENAISAAPWTQPSMASIFTSLYASRHAMLGFLPREEGKSGEQEEPKRIYALHESIPTLASSLREAGYETAAFWTNDWLAEGSGFEKGFDNYTRVRGDATVVVREAFDYLEQRSPERPFFLYLHMMDVHGPYGCRRRDYEVLSNSPSLPPDRALTRREYRRLGYLKNLPVQWPSDELQKTLRFWNTCYAAGVRRFDRSLGDFLAALEQEERFRNTVVVFTSDHGEAMLEHAGAAHTLKNWEHGFSLYFHQTRIPLLIRLPDRKSAGTRIPSVVSSVDIMPTLLALAEARIDFAVHGRDLTPLFNAEGQAPSCRVFSSAMKLSPSVMAVQDETHKLIWTVPTESLSLFDIIEDPRETTDIAAREPQIVEKLKKLAIDQLERMKLEPSPKPRSVVPDQQVIEELRALGYVE